MTNMEGWILKPTHLSIFINAKQDTRSMNDFALKLTQKEK